MSSAPTRRRYDPRTGEESRGLHPGAPSRSRPNQRARLPANLGLITREVMDDAGVLVQRRYTRQFGSITHTYAKFLLLKEFYDFQIMFIFPYFSYIYSLLDQLKIRGPQGRGGSNPPPGTTCPLGSIPGRASFRRQPIWRLRTTFQVQTASLFLSMGHGYGVI